MVLALVIRVKIPLLYPRLNLHNVIERGRYCNILTRDVSKRSLSIYEIHFPLTGNDYFMDFGTTANALQWSSAKHPYNSPLINIPGYEQ